MVRYNSSNYSSLRTRLTSFADYLEAMAELHTQLLHSSPSCLTSYSEELISLVEVAKSTLQNNGVSLHTFSSCPEYLSAYKAAYFGLLLQLQAHSHNIRLESKDLQVRLNRLLFPLSTQLRVSAKSAGQAVQSGYATQVCGVKQASGAHSAGPIEVKPARRGHEASFTSQPLLERPGLPPGPPNLPPNVMLPPPTPIRHSNPVTSRTSMPTAIPSKPFFSYPRNKSSRQLSSRQEVSQDTLHFKRRRGEPVFSHSESKNLAELREDNRDPKSRCGFSWHGDGFSEVHIDEADTSGSSSEGDDSDSDSGHVVIPENSPLRRSFGIFCTGKGRGTFTGSVHVLRRRPRSIHRNDQFGLRRGAKEDIVDTE